MTLLLLAYLGGVLTIVSPCILPVLPFVFARADQPFVRSGLPLLIGMALMFAGVATLATVGGGWAIRANEYGRIEIFGPVISAIRFKDMDSLLKRANATTFGLGSGVWTRDLSKAHALARGLRAGSVWVNCYQAMDPADPLAVTR